MEHTGIYYTCLNCEHIWDFDDFNCPECGKQTFNDVNANYIRSTYAGQTPEYKQYLENMLQSHDD